MLLTIGLRWVRAHDRDAVCAAAVLRLDLLVAERHLPRVVETIRLLAAGIGLGPRAPHLDLEVWIVADPVLGVEVVERFDVLRDLRKRLAADQLRRFQLLDGLLLGLLGFLGLPNPPSPTRLLGLLLLIGVLEGTVIVSIVFGGSHESFDLRHRRVFHWGHRSPPRRSTGSAWDSDAASGSSSSGAGGTTSSSTPSSISSISSGPSLPSTSTLSSSSPSSSSPS